MFESFAEQSVNDHPMLHLEMEGVRGPVIYLLMCGENRKLGEVLQNLLFKIF